MVRPFPDHMAVRLVAENRDLATADQIGDLSQVIFARHTAGRVVRRIQKDGPRRRVVGDKLLDVGQRRARAATLDVRHVGREIRAENQHAVAGIQEGLAEELLEDLGAGPRDDVFHLCRDAEFFLHELRRRLPKLRYAR